MLFPALAFSAPETLASTGDAARLAALYEAELLGTPPEAAFDRITRLAARVLNAPRAALTLIDSERQVIKSAFGMEAAPFGQCLQTPLSHSVCQYVVEQDAPLAIDDAPHDCFFANHRAVTEDGVVAYLGVPIHWEDAEGKRRALGALCVWDAVARAWQPEDTTLLEEFAALVETEFRLRATAQKSRRQSLAVAEALAAEARSEARFHGVTNASPLGVFVLDASGDCVYINPKLAQIAGSSSAELLGGAFMAAIHAEDRERVLKRWHKAVGRRREFHSVHRMARPNRMGREVWVSVKAAPLHGAAAEKGDGDFLGWAGTLDDISERKAAEDALTETFRFVHQITETVPLIMTVTDLRQQQNVYTNHEFTSVLGYRAEDMQHTAILPPPSDETKTTGSAPETDRAFIYAKMHPEDRAGYDAHIRRVLQQGTGETPLACQYRLQNARGQWCWFRSRDTVFERDRATGEPTHLLSIAEDVTSAKNHEDKLLALTDQLKRSNASLQEFASVASHDLQEPLRKVQAFGDRLRSRYGDVLEGDGAEYLDRMLAASARMQVLIDDLLRYSRVSSKAQEFRPVDLDEIAQGVVGDLETRIQQTGGRIMLGPLPHIEADPMQMRQLLQNLLGNALKFHKPDCPPEVRVSAEISTPKGRNDLPGSAEETGAVCRISIQDNGIGFEAQYAERVFNVFERLHSRGHFEGTGMGLAICRKITQRHGGTISAHSHPEQGTLFLVTLPLAHTPELPSASGQETLPAAPPASADAFAPASDATFLTDSKGMNSV